MIFLCTCEGLVPRLVFSVLRNEHTKLTVWWVLYCIARNLWGRNFHELVKKFSPRNFHEFLAFAAPKDVTPPNFTEKTLWIATKPWNSQKFAPAKVSHYTVYEQSMCYIFPTVSSRVTQSRPLHVTCFGQYQATLALLGWPGNVRTLLPLLFQAYLMCGTVATSW